MCAKEEKTQQEQENPQRKRKLDSQKHRRKTIYEQTDFIRLRGRTTNGAPTSAGRTQLSVQPQVGEPSRSPRAAVVLGNQLCNTLVLKHPQLNEIQAAGGFQENIDRNTRKTP